MLSELLSARDRIVTDYGSIQRTGPPVNWTSLFPGGNGLWQEKAPPQSRKTPFEVTAVAITERL